MQVIQQRRRPLCKPDRRCSRVQIERGCNCADLQHRFRGVGNDDAQFLDLGRRGIDRVIGKGPKHDLEVVKASVRDRQEIEY